MSVEPALRRLEAGEPDFPGERACLQARPVAAQQIERQARIAQCDAPKLMHQQQPEAERGEVRASLGWGKRRGNGRVVIAKSPIGAGDLVELPGRPGNLAVLLQIVRFARLDLALNAKTRAASSGTS